VVRVQQAGDHPPRARSGIGALSFSFAEPEDAAHWVAEYYD